MEDTLREKRSTLFIKIVMVLILVLMEDTLRDLLLITFLHTLKVLILVLMEDTLRDPSFFNKSAAEVSLNPCFNGRYAQRARHTNPLYKRDWYL